MATDKEASCPTCSSDPNFAVICSFLNKFSGQCGITFPTFAELQDMLEDTQEVSQVLIDMHVKLLRKARKSFTADKWEKALAKFCHTYSQQDGWELERFGYKKARLGVKVKLLKVLLETQFDVNGKFKTEVNKLTPNDLRLEPLGRDQTGLTYWCQFDPSSHVRVYREDVDDETWELVAKDRDGLVQLIDSLSNGEGQRELNNILNEDSTSQEIEKPITDTGQDQEAEAEADENEDMDEEEVSDEDLEEDEEEEDDEEGQKREEEKKKELDNFDKIKPVERLADENKTTDTPEAKAVDNGIVQSTDANETNFSDVANANENNLAGVDLSIRAEPRKCFTPSQQGNFYMIPDRQPMPETANILTQMSARFNEKSKAESSSIDLSMNTNARSPEPLEILNPPKRVKLADDDEQALMLVKNDMKLPEECEEPISLVTGSSVNNETADMTESQESEVSETVEERIKNNEEPGSEQESNIENSRETSSPLDHPSEKVVESEPEFSEAIEEPVQYVNGCGSGADCDVGNPSLLYSESEEDSDGLDVREESVTKISDPEFSDVISDPVQYVVGFGSGVDCEIGNPERFVSGELPSFSKHHQHEGMNEPEFSQAIEEPIQYVRGTGSGAECGVGSPRHVKHPKFSTSSSSIPTMGIECSMNNLSLQAFEPSFSDVIEEPIMLVYGSGYGHDCLTGNPDEKEDSIEESTPEKRPKLLIENSNIEVSGNSEGNVSVNTLHSIESIDFSKKIEDLKKGIAQEMPLSLKVPLGIRPTEEKNSVNDKQSDHKAKENKCDFKGFSGINNTSEENHVGKECGSSEGAKNPNGIEDSNSTSNNEDIVKKDIDDSSTDSSSHHMKNNLSFLKTDTDSERSEISIPNSKPESQFSFSKSLSNDEASQLNSVEEKGKKSLNDTKSKNAVGRRNSRITSRTKSTTQESLLTNDNSKSGDDKLNDSDNSHPLKNNKCKDSSGKNSLVSNKDAPLLEDLENITANVDNLNSIDSSKDNCVNPPKNSSKKLTSNEESLINAKENSNSLDSNSSKKGTQRKNVMLTNIIEICLDNDTNSKGSGHSDIKEKGCARYFDLFSAKDLVNPPNKKDLNKESEEKPKVEEETVNPPKEEICNISQTEVPIENVKKENYEESVKSEEVKEEPVSDVKMKSEGSNPEDNNCPEGENVCKLEDDAHVKAKEEPEIKKEEEKIKKEEEEIKKEEEEMKTEETQAKPPPRGRKSRTNSLCNEQEVEIPNKIRKTDKVEPKPTRRSTRRSNRSNSQSGLNSVSEDENKKIESNEEKNKSPQNEDGKVKSDDKDEKSEDKGETEEKKESTDRAANLPSISVEEPPNDGPVGKNQNRKRRSSMRMSRSEEEATEVKEEEEAGGKKPRLRGKARRGRGRGSAPASRPPPEASSSDEDDTVENKEEDQSQEVGGKKRGRGTLRARAAKPVPAKTKSDTTPAQTSAAESKKKSNKSKSDVKSEEDVVKETKKQAPPKKSTKTAKKGKGNKKKKEEAEEKENESDSESGNKKTKATRAGKKGKKSSSKAPQKQKKTSKEEKQESDDEEEEEGDEEEEEEDEEEEASKPIKEKESKSKELKDAGSNSKDESQSVDKEEPEPDEEEKPKTKKPRTPKKKTLLGLMESDLIHSKPAVTDADDGGARVRQSRRIAQIKIKEEAERRAIEEATMLSIKEMKKTKKEEKQPTSKKSKKKKGRSEMGSEDEDETFKDPIPEEKKRGRKKKKRKDRLKYNENRPWQSSSDSSSEEVDEEEEHYEEEDDEEDIRTKQLVSDHEFSPESDLENEGEEESAVPVRRARTAKKDTAVADDTEEKEEEPVEDYPCKKCGQPDHPEWILLCDKCDNGYHASCLRPPLMLIPEGDWFCPPCQHADLVEKLKETLRTFEKNTKKRENEELRRKRIAYVGISLANVLPNVEKTSRRPKSSSEYSSSEEEEETESSEDEPVYQLRQRRTALQANYRFNDYDELINSAIQDEMEAVKGAGNMGRGKDIANIVDAEKGEQAAEGGEGEGAENRENGPLDEDEEQGENWRPRVVPKNTALPSLRKKPKKLTDLDRASDDDADSDEDFKGSSEEEEYSSTEGADSGDSEAKVPVRRSSRNRISRIDKEFINDDSESSDEPRRKKTKKLYASSSSESSDSTWGRRKRKSKSYSRIRSSKGGKKKKKNYFDSDSDRPKKVKSKRPKIKYGLSDDDDDAGPIRRTRGKKVSYLDVAGSDTEEEVIRRSRKLPSDDEEEFIPEKEAVDEEEAEPEEDEEVKDDINYDDEDEVEKDDKEDSSADEAVDKNLNDKNEMGPAVIVEPVKSAEVVSEHKVSDGEDIEEEEEDDVEEEEIEEEIEEEVEEEEEEAEIDEKPDEAKNLAVPKLRIVDTRDLIRKEPEVERKVPPVTITVVKKPVPPPVGSPVIQPTPMAASQPDMPINPPTTAAPTPTSFPTPVIKVEDKKEEKEEKKEPVPAIRLVPSAKLLDPNKHRRVAEESVIRGMLGSGYYRPQRIPQPPHPQFRQRYQEQPRYSMYQPPPPPPPSHQYYPTGGYYANEDYSGYEEHMDQAVVGGDEDGVFSGLVSYFSSQREDNIDS